jgi:restriction system protein
MPIPDFQKLMLPVLRACAHGPITTSALVSAMADEFGLTESERSHLLPSGRQPTIANRVHWALAYLNRSGLLDRVSRGTYAASEQGRSVLARPPERITVAFLRQFPEFRSLRPDDSYTAEPLARGDGVPASPESRATPDEQITAAVVAIEANLREDLLRRLLAAPPAFFEKVVVDLLLAMGYGSTAEDAGQALGGSGDGGVDGVIREDRLGLDLIYVQAKRYKDNAITPDQLRSFAGALDDKGARKGVFITTSRFTSEAERFAERQQMKRIVLIDGDRLTRLMLRHDVGVRADRTIALKRVDLDYFEPDDAV